MVRRIGLLLAVLAGALAPVWAVNAGVRTLIPWPPPGAVILFDGKNLDGWLRTNGDPAPWKLQNGAMTVSGGNIMSKETFEDCYLHLEFNVPDMPDAKGQSKGNSGVYLQGLYEIQVLDSYGWKVPGKGDCGAIYGQHAPLVNACLPPGRWQTFDVIFRAPRFDAEGKVIALPRVTVFQNGTLIQNNVEVGGSTTAALARVRQGPGPLMLQDHGCPVQYRNIWLLHLPAEGSSTYGPQ